jgi:uncharacterized membrane protein YfcA
MTDLFYITFRESGVTTWVFIPPLVAFVVSFLTSMGGVSGAFALLPFQMSVLGYTAPSVSGTNQLFNVLAIPSGVWRYARERRMVWPLTLTVIVGTLPGVVVGSWIRLAYLPDVKNFKFFAAFVLAYIGIRLLADTLSRKAAVQDRESSRRREDFFVSETRFSLKQAEFRFGGQRFAFSVPTVSLICLIVGIVGGVYGIGGGAIVAPLLVAFFHLPVYAVAGAALMGTLVTSVAGVIVFQLLAPAFSGMSVAPDWYLGLLFGVGGLFGIYLGARCQKYVPVHVIKLILCICVLFVACKYVLDFIR